MQEIYQYSSGINVLESPDSLSLPDRICFSGKDDAKGRCNGLWMFLRLPLFINASTTELTTYHFR